MSAAPPFLRGPRVHLRALSEADADGHYVTWLNDAEACAGNSHHVFPFSREAAREFIRSNQNRQDSLMLAIVIAESGRHVGNIVLNQIHPRHRSAEFAILLGDRSVWGTGIGYEASLLLIEHGFKALGLHRIYCGTYANNVGMMALAFKLGMREEGRRIEAAWKNGQFVDVVEFAVLSAAFLAV
ncbi:GNAT family N-acetyltransferase [Chitinimonas sp. BJB300]|uniref:GNAT family N-acetyltransferase n=1 Tax=Chitinimonas sp. BJB300 TaxID=1559339 RepID=UPI000C0E44EF|nr:GNAT family protein [Chitinimonas sp. BJB300]PHV12481.1 GNAT family N-acetyltransferase [Chitinimonas sp. BJB300]TSJ89130.1 GNAT family N-acetyltransferase [Chitinimonas sp. BJB300]